MQAFGAVTGRLPGVAAAVSLLLPAAVLAEPTPGAGGPAIRTPLATLERLEQELAESRRRVAEQQAQLAAETARQEALARELADLRRSLTGTAAAPAAAAPATPVPSAASQPLPAVAYTPGKGFALQAGGGTLLLKGEARLLGFSSSRYVFNPGQPLVVSPKDPNPSFDLTAQQSTVTAAFQGPERHGWRTGAFALFTLQDNLLAEGYSFTPVAFYSDIGHGRWRIAAGQNFDLFAPRDPDNLTSGKLAGTGNPGAYRPQLRVEHSLTAGPAVGALVQLGVSSPITTALPTDIDPTNLRKKELIEDNGWPNVEGRLQLGFGSPADRAGGRRLRPVELGLSGVVGQLRVLDRIRLITPLNVAASQSTVEVWGAALDGQVALGRRLGLSGELYTGQGLGEYMAGIFQTTNRRTNQAVTTSGGWGQLQIHLADALRLNLGYGVDNAQHIGRFGLQLNSTAFANLVWDVNPWLQLGLEGNAKLTTYDRFGDKDAWVVITELLLRL